MSPVTVTITPPPAVIVTATSPTSLRVAVTPVAPVQVRVAPATVVGGTAAYQFAQAIPTSTWVINHNLGFSPVVQTFSTGGEEIEGAVIHLTPNTTQVSFAAPIAGTARAI